MNPPNEVVTGPDGRAQIVLRDGLNCHANQCLRIDARRGTVELPGQEPVQVPGVDLTSGRVNAEDFARLLRAARLAPGLGGGDDPAPVAPGLVDPGLGDDDEAVDSDIDIPDIA